MKYLLCLLVPLSGLASSLQDVVFKDTFLQPFKGDFSILREVTYRANENKIFVSVTVKNAKRDTQLFSNFDPFLIDLSDTCYAGMAEVDKTLLNEPRSDLLMPNEASHFVRGCEPEYGFYGGGTRITGYRGEIALNPKLADDMKVLLKEKCYAYKAAELYQIKEDIEWKQKIHCDGRED